MENYPVLTRDERFRMDKLLVEQGVSLVPRIRGTKSPPRGFPLMEYYNGKIATLEQIGQWSDLDRAAVCGVHGLVVLDFDSMALFELFWEKNYISRIAAETLCVKTARGFQIWFFDLSLDLEKLPSTINISIPKGKDPKNIVLEQAAEIFVQRHLAAVPGNLHPTGVEYKAVGTLRILRKDGVVYQSLERFRSLKCNISSHEICNPGTFQSVSPGSLGLTEWQMSQVTSALAQLWTKGNHHGWIISSAGWFVRLGVHEEQAAFFLSTLAGQLGCKSREHTDQRVFRQVVSLYKDAKKGKKVPGITSLIQLAKLQSREDLGNDLLDLNQMLRRRRENVSSI